MTNIPCAHERYTTHERDGASYDFCADCPAWEPKSDPVRVPAEWNAINRPTKKRASPKKPETPAGKPNLKSLAAVALIQERYENGDAEQRKAIRTLWDVGLFGEEALEAMEAMKVVVGPHVALLDEILDAVDRREGK